MAKERGCRHPTQALPPHHLPTAPHPHLSCISTVLGTPPSMTPQFIYFSKGKKNPSLLLAAFCVCARLFSRLDAGLTLWKKKPPPLSLLPLSRRLLLWKSVTSVWCLPDVKADVCLIGVYVVRSVLLREFAGRCRHVCSWKMTAMVLL